jgi:hypothetical protein
MKKILSILLSLVIVVPAFSQARMKTFINGVEYNRYRAGQKMNAFSEKYERNYNARANSLFYRMINQPTDSTKIMISMVYDSLAGIVDSLDCLYLLKAETEDQAVLNWAQNSYNLTKSKIAGGTTYPSCIPYVGWYGDGSTTYLNTGFNPATANGKYTLNNAMYGCGVKSSAASTTKVQMGLLIGTNRANFYTKYTASVTSFGVNSGARTSIANTNSTDIILIQRTTSNVNGLYVDGDSVGTVNQASTAIPSGDFYLLAGNSNNTTISGAVTDTMYFACIGRALTAEQHDRLNRVIKRYNAYMDRQQQIAANSTKNLIYRDDNYLYVASKLSTTKDLVIRFGRTYQNNLITFINVYMNSNSNANVSFSVLKTEDLLNTAYQADNIGPHSVVGQNWTGGNHGYDYGVMPYSKLTSNYTAGGAVMILEDTDDFIQTGGKARTSADVTFTYTGISGDTLKGVNCSTSLSSGDSVKIYHATANTTEYSYKINGLEIPKYRYMVADSVNITAHNTMFKMSTLNKVTGLADTLFYEDVAYCINKGTIQVKNTITPLENYQVSSYYGLQLAGGDWADTLYFASNYTPNIWPLPDVAAKSGDKDDYPSYRAIKSKDDKTINVSLRIENTGLSADRLLNDTMSMWWNPSKIYNNFIYKSSEPFFSFNTGQSYNWTGYYNFFGENYSTQDSLEYSYPEYKNKAKYWYISTQRAYTDTIDFPYNVSGYTVIEKTDSITIGTVNNNKLPIISTGRGWAEIKLE